MLLLKKALLVCLLFLISISGYAVDYSDNDSGGYRTDDSYYGSDADFKPYPTTRTAFYIMGGLGLGWVRMPSNFTNFALLNLNDNNPETLPEYHFAFTNKLTGVADLAIGMQFPIWKSSVVGGELGYIRFASNNYFYTDINMFGLSYGGGRIYLKQSADYFAIKLKHYMNKKFSFIGKVGIARVKQSVDSSGIYLNVVFVGQSNVFTLLKPYNIHKTEPVLALGFGYNFTPKFSMDMLYQYTGGASAGDEDITHLTVASAKIYSTHSMLLHLMYAF